MCFKHAILLRYYFLRLNLKCILVQILATAPLVVVHSKCPILNFLLSYWPIVGIMSTVSIAIAVDYSHMPVIMWASPTSALKVYLSLTVFDLVVKKMCGLPPNECWIQQPRFYISLFFFWWVKSPQTWLG